MMTLITDTHHGQVKLWHAANWEDAKEIGHLFGNTDRYFTALTNYPDDLDDAENELVFGDCRSRHLYENWAQLVEAFGDPWEHQHDYKIRHHIKETLLIWASDDADAVEQLDELIDDIHSARPSISQYLEQNPKISTRLANLIDRIKAVLID